MKSAGVVGDQLCFGLFLFPLPRGRPTATAGASRTCENEPGPPVPLPGQRSLGGACTLITLPTPVRPNSSGQAVTPFFFLLLFIPQSFFHYLPHYGGPRQQGAPAPPQVISQAGLIPAGGAPAFRMPNSKCRPGPLSFSRRLRRNLLWRSLRR